MPPQRKVLHVAEKPSVAKSLAQTLSSGRCSSRQGTSQYNRLYEFDRDGPVGSLRSSQIVTSVTGHLMTTAFAEPYNNWNSCPVRDLLCEELIPVEWKVPPDKQPLKRQLETEARKANVLVLWLDCDLEGEAIAFEVIAVCMSVNAKMDVWRAKFSSLDRHEVEKAWRTLGRPDKNKSDAVEARAELDLRSGAAFTRFQTFRVQGKYKGVDDLVSYGPCQFPTLGFIVERQHEIDAHVPRDFWRIELETVRFDAADERNTTVRWAWRRKRLYERLPAFILFELCHEAKTLQIASVDARPAKKARPLPLQTIELQKRASRWLKISSSETMEIAESLYQRGFVSYPRTETDIFKESCDLKHLLDSHRHDRRWGRHVSKLLDDPPGSPSSFEWPRKGGRDDNAHPPIHPIKAVAPGELQNRKEEQIYELIARHFIACCSRDACGEQTNVTATLACEVFETRGLVVNNRNYLDVYTYEKWQGVQLPRFDLGSNLDAQSAVSKLELCQSATEPPRALTEADLLAKMDQHGIGTDATMADHIRTVLQREYAVKNESTGTFTPMALGLALVDAYDAMGERLNRPHLRAQLEADIGWIARGSKRKVDVVRDALTIMRRCFDTVIEDASKLDSAMQERFANGNRPRHPNIGHVERAGGLSNCDNGGPDPSGFETPCGTCDGAMQLHVRQLDNNKRRFALKCETCLESWAMPDYAERFDKRPECCLLCGFQVIQVHEAFHSYVMCPKCSRRPPKGAVFKGGDFTCNDCTAQGCPLASGVRLEGNDKAVCQCYQCRDHPMYIERNQYGGLYLACKSQQTCGARISLPNATASVKVLTSKKCSRCKDRQLLSLNCLKTSAVHKIRTQAFRVQLTDLSFSYKEQRSRYMQTYA